MNLTVVVITCRQEPQFNWTIHSLVRELNGDTADVLLVSGHASEVENILSPATLSVSVIWPKPCIWSGPHRKTPVEWWSKANSINTALCVAQQEWVLFLDDRAVLVPGFLDGIRQAMAEQYILAGSYEKRINMKVKDGVIIDSGETVGLDHRTGSPAACLAPWLFGCVVLARLDWWLDINGSPEKSNSIGFEDCLTGFLFQNAGHTIKFDSRSKIITDRTNESKPRRDSKEKHSYDVTDKVHTALRFAKANKFADNDFNIRELRASIAKGGQFPIPQDQDYFDWFDGQNLKDMR